MRPGISRVWQKALAWSTLHVPRRFYYPIMLLRILNVIPGVLGVIHNTLAAWHVSERDAGGAIALRSTQADYIVANLWCGLAGYWCWIATTSMLRRWLHHYEVGNAIVRLTTLVVITWSISAFVDSKRNAQQPVQRWIIKSFILLVTNIIRLCIASRARYRRNPINLTSTVVKALVLPLSAVTCLTVCVALQLMDRLQYTTSQLMTHQPYKLDTTVQLPSNQSVIALILIVSSWTQESFERRQMLRRTTLRLLADDAVYRFVVGQPPTAHAQMTTGHNLIVESNTYHDLLVVPTSDLSKGKGRKVFEAMRWSHSVTYDFLIKTDDDMFVRWDVILSELRAPNQNCYYWKGLAFRNMEDTSFDYSLRILPQYTAGSLYVVSQDMIRLATLTGSPRRFVAGDDGRNLAMWLFGFRVHPTHDRRFHNGGGCKDDFVSRRVKHARLHEMERMYKNVVRAIPQCTGLEIDQCAPCYPCQGRNLDPSMAELHCDPVKGIRPRTPKVTVVSLTAEKMADMQDRSEWIPENIISTKDTSMSVSFEDEHWHRLYWVAWIADSPTLTEHQRRALELVLIQEPDAAVFVLSTASPSVTDEIFKGYQERGYIVRVININADKLLQWQWYLGPSTHDWLQDYRTWEYSQYFPLHLTDYLSSVLLYKYGGTFMDLSRLWIHLPPKDAQFFVSEGDTDTLSPSLMRFKRGWPLIKQVAETVFSRASYDPTCLDCQSTYRHLNKHRQELKKASVIVLPNEIQYPTSYHDAHKLLLLNPQVENKAVTLLVDHWHVQRLAGIITRHIPANFEEMLEPIFRQFDLGLWQPTMELVGPSVYHHSRGQPGTFQGARVIYMRGGSTRKPLVQVKIQYKVMFGSIRVDEKIHTSWSTVITNTTQKEVNEILSTIAYVPPNEGAIHNDQLWIHVSNSKEFSTVINIMIT